MSRSRMSWFMIAAAVVLLVGCHTITEEAPTEPTEVTEEPTLAAITIPVILPASNPTPAPAPTPIPGTTPTPEPEPESTPPAPPPSGSGCNVPPNNPGSLSCTDAPAQFLDEVESAITRVTNRYPELFDFDNKKCGNCYFVKDVERYIAAVMTELSAAGLCSRWDGEEVAVKNSNTFSEQYDIILASNHIRRGSGAYRGVCYPAWF